MSKLCLYNEEGVFVKRLYVICLCLCLVGCAPSTIEEETIADSDITIGCAPYISAIVMSNLAKEILGQKGYVADIEILENVDLYENLSRNKVGATVSAWFYDKDYIIYESIKDKVEDLGSSCEYLTKGLAVPEYVDVAEISELNMYRAKFNDIIYCFDEIPLLYELTKKANTVYDLDYKLVKISEQEIDKNLEDAIKKGEWIVFSGYIPHWFFAKYNLRFLADTEIVFEGQQEIHTLVNKNLETEDKEIYNILDGFYLYKEELNDLLYEVDKAGIDNLNKTVFEWLIKHNDVASRNQR